MSTLTMTIDGELDFDADKIERSENPISSNFKLLTIPRGIARINIVVVTHHGSNGNVATFPSSPIDFVGTPTPLAGTFEQAVASNGLSMQITDTNDSGNAEGTFRYNISVEYAGTIYTHDPVIINEPPAL